MKVYFDTIERDGAVLVLHTNEDIESMAKNLDSEAEDADSDADRKSFEAIAKRLRKDRRRIEKLAEGRIKRVDFDVKPYSTLDRMEATERATTYETGQPILNNGKKWVILVSRATGLDESRVGELPPALFDALAGKVKAMSEPDPARIDFFVSAPLSSEKGPA